MPMYTTHALQIGVIVYIISFEMLIYITYAIISKNVICLPKNVNATEEYLLYLNNHRHKLFASTKNVSNAFLPSFPWNLITAMCSSPSW